MPTVALNLRTAVVGALAFAAAVLPGGAAAQDAPSELLPNLKPRPASSIYLRTDSAGRSTLRYSTTSWNSGAGPLELVAGDIDRHHGTQRVFQRIYLREGGAYDRPAGHFLWDGDHHHFHLDNYALATLEPREAPGGMPLSGSKTSFCIMDTNLVNPFLPGAPWFPYYSTCGASIQGMSVGWADTYGSHLPGQEIDFTPNPNGRYQLKLTIDPGNVIWESDETDNVSCVVLDIRKPRFVRVRWDIPCN